MLEIDRFNNLTMVEGDTSFIIVDVKDYTLTSKDTITLHVGDILSKSYPCCSKDKFIIPLFPSDTLNKEGVYDYQIEVKSANDNITLNHVIHKATFKIIKKVGVR